MSQPEPAIELVLKHEGGYANNPNDKGKATKYGISHGAFPELDIAGLTLAHAKQLYLDHYWTPYRLDLIKSQHIANFVFDLLVNMGAYHNLQIVQRACNNLGADIAIDGKMGPCTLKAINEANEYTLKLQIVIEATKFYRELNKPQFIHGWLNRVADDEANA